MTSLEYKCDCDCECSKEMKDARNPGTSLNQCDDCDNGIHWDRIRKIYVNYEDEG